MNLPDFNRLRRAKSEVAYKVAARYIKTVLDGFVASCRFMNKGDYKKIKEVNEELKKAIDKKDKQQFDYLCSQLNYYVNVKPKADKIVTKERAEWEKKREKVRKQIEKVAKRKLKKMEVDQHG